MNKINYILLGITLIISFSTNAQQSSRWKIDEGWAFRKDQNSEYQKFFAIGLWEIPGYTFNKLSVNDEAKKYPNNLKEYKKNTSEFNIIYIQSGYEKNYMKDHIAMVGTSEFPWFIKEYYLKNNKSITSYNMMREIDKSTQSYQTRKTVNEVINLIANSNKTKDYIWATFDEIANGYDNWHWPTNLTDMIYAEIKKKTPDKLVFIDLIGSYGGAGNTFLFEQQYKQNHKELPNAPPYKLTTNRKNNDLSLLDFHVDYKGNPVFENKNGNRIPQKIDKEIWYENIKQTANGYKNSGDIFGINAFRIAYENPEIIGITVDAIKDGISKNTPVWIFFDANGYAKPSSMSVENYLKNIRCQIYTSIIHGATGVLFWSDLTKNNKVFTTLIPIIKELKKNEYIFYLKTTEQKMINNIHYMIKEGNDRTRYLIAVNISRTKNAVFKTNYTTKTTLSPLEVYICKI